MLHPLFATLVRRPDLLLNHVSAYAALIQCEAAKAGADLRARSLAWAAFILGALVFGVLAGVALMLGVMLGRFEWVLVLVPGAVLLLTGLAWRKTRSAQESAYFAEVRVQLDSDVQALRSAT